MQGISVKASTGYETEEESSVDMDYFNKQRAYILKRIALAFPKDADDFQYTVLEQMIIESKILMYEIENEFGCNISQIIDFVYAKKPNKISIVVEFEWIKSAIGRVPTKQDIENHSRFGVTQYESEFGSFERLVDRLGYDPWYRKENSLKVNKQGI